MVKLAAVVALLTGFVSLAGGLQGGLGPAKSTPSLIAGGAAGILLLLFGGLAFGGRGWAFVVVLVLGIALAGRFLPAFLKDTTNLWPALVMAVLGAATAALAAVALLVHPR